MKILIAGNDKSENELEIHRKIINFIMEKYEDHVTYINRGDGSTMIEIQPDYE